MARRLTAFDNKTCIPSLMRYPDRLVPKDCSFGASENEYLLLVARFAVMNNLKGALLGRESLIVSIKISRSSKAIN